MIVVTKESMREFILAQPDSRAVNMAECKVGQACGCVMVHYGRAIGLNFTTCYSRAWKLEGALPPKLAATLDFCMGNLIEYGFANESKTYGELKKQLV